MSSGSSAPAAAPAHRPASPRTLDALRSPRLFTREALAGLVVAVAGKMQDSQSPIDFVVVVVVVAAA